jgi:hypothetical protein
VDIVHLTAKVGMAGAVCRGQPAIVGVRKILRQLQRGPAAGAELERRHVQADARESGLPTDVIRIGHAPREQAQASARPYACEPMTQRLVAE